MPESQASSDWPVRRFAGPRPDGFWRALRIGGDRLYGFWTIQYGDTYGVHPYGWEHAGKIPALTDGDPGKIGAIGNRAFRWRPLSELPPWAAPPIKRSKDVA